MKLVILTGMSGAGKSTALKMMEDIGFYCVDNLPIPLIEKFIELADLRNTELQKVAVGVDIRSGQALEDLQDILDHLRGEGKEFDVLFLDAEDGVLVKRYQELMADKTYLDSMIKMNDEKAAYYSNKTLRKVQKKVGLTERIR